MEKLQTWWRKQFSSDLEMKIWTGLLVGTLFLLFMLSFLNYLGVNTMIF